MGFEFSDIGDAAASVAGKAAGAVSNLVTDPIGTVRSTATDAVDLVNDGANTVGGLLSKIPVLGPLYQAEWTYVTSPIFVMQRITQGNPIDSVALQTLKRETGVAKTVAPYAQTVMTLVPGVGPIASGAISAGIALAEGQDIDDVLVAGVTGMIPGGALARTAYKITSTALKGENIGKAIGKTAIKSAIEASGIQVPDATASVLAAGINVAKDAAQGKDVRSEVVSEAIQALPTGAKALAVHALEQNNPSALADVLLNAGKNMLPDTTPEQREAIDVALKTGIAIGVGNYFQNAAREEAKNDHGFLQAAGAQAAAYDQAMKAARDIIKKAELDRLSKTAIVKNVAKSQAPMTKGFDIGAGLMSHGISKLTFNAVRGSLTGKERQGFDTAVAYKIGQVTSPKPDVLGDARQQAGYLITRGLAPNKPDNRAEIMKTVASNDVARIGASYALSTMPSKSWLSRLLEWLGF